MEGLLNWIFKGSSLDFQKGRETVVYRTLSLDDTTDVKKIVVKEGRVQIEVTISDTVD